MLRFPFARAASRRPAAALCGAALLCCVLTLSPPAVAQDRDDPIRAAREAFARKDRPRLAALRTQLVEARHPLAPWADYWELTSRLGEARVEEVEAFYQRWPGSYVEDRLRNDWLLELGHRRDWARFSRDLPRFRMNDDREVACYAQVAQLLGASDPAPLRDGAVRAWMAQREADEGCQLLAKTLVEARLIDRDDLWHKIRRAAEFNKPRLAQQTATLIDEAVARAVGQIFDSPARYLATRATAIGHARSELTSIALVRLGAGGSDQAVSLLEDRWASAIGAEHAAWVWAVFAKQAAQALRPEAPTYARRAWDLQPKRQRGHPDWSDDTLGWMARAALRQTSAADRWTQVLRAIDAMTPSERADPTWQYWRARALQASARPGEAGDAARAEARQILAGLSGQLHFYGLLAAEDLGGPAPLPARSAPPSDTERSAARALPGLQRALSLIAVGLRSEGVREWNFTLIGMSDRELLAAAQLACEKEVWDRCINTSERTKAEIDLEQRFPQPMRGEVLAKAREIDLDPAYVYGLIRQESRFVTDARSAVGASGLMQVMPATAKWTARKIGLDFTPAMLTDRDTNLKLGTAYLKLVLESFDGSQALAAAAYNAGPARPRRWRDGPLLEPAIWAENIPFAETRDYVKKVLTNATIYAGLMAGKPASLKARLGGPIGPRAAGAPAVDADLP
jgi:soluble lytic murein transglycosylase